MNPRTWVEGELWTYNIMSDEIRQVTDQLKMQMPPKSSPPRIELPLVGRHCPNCAAPLSSPDYCEYCGSGRRKRIIIRHDDDLLRTPTPGMIINCQDGLDITTMSDGTKRYLVSGTTRSTGPR